MSLPEASQKKPWRLATGNFKIEQDLATLTGSEKFNLLFNGPWWSTIYICTGLFFYRCSIFGLSLGLCWVSTFRHRDKVCLFREHTQVEGCRFLSVQVSTHSVSGLSEILCSQTQFTSMDGRHGMVYAFGFTVFSQTAVNLLVCMVYVYQTMELIRSDQQPQLFIPRLHHIEWGLFAFLWTCCWQLGYHNTRYGN